MQLTRGQAHTCTPVYRGQCILLYRKMKIGGLLRHPPPHHWWNHRSSISKIISNRLHEIFWKWTKLKHMAALPLIQNKTIHVIFKLAGTMHFYSRNYYHKISPSTFFAVAAATSMSWVPLCEGIFSVTTAVSSFFLDVEMLRFPSAIGRR